MAEDLLVAGVDSSTQSTKVLVCRASTGEVVRTGRAPHPDGTSVDPAAWWDAWTTATSDGLLEGVAALSVGGQQHGMVALDEDDAVVRDALLWNDTRSADAATALIDELGGAQAWVDAVDLVPVASFTVTKLRWLAEHEPENAARVARVVLPHDWLTGRILRDGGTSAGWTTDRGDASGTGYWSAASGYRHDLVERAFGRDLGLPRVLAPSEAAGTTDRRAGGGRRDRRQHGRRARAAARSRATSRSRSAPAARSSPRTTGPWATRPASSPGSPTRPAGTCRWPAR